MIILEVLPKHKNACKSIKSATSKPSKNLLKNIFANSDNNKIILYGKIPNCKMTIKSFDKKN